MNLHNSIMNLPCETLQNSGEYSVHLAYKTGHKVARHQAAELAIQADERIEELEGHLTNILEWLEQNQPDVFSRGLWDSVDKLLREPE
jgi:predicted ATPase